MKMEARCTKDQNYIMYRLIKIPSVVSLLQRAKNR